MFVNYWDIYSYSLGQKDKLLKFYKIVNQYKAYQCKKKILVHGIIRSFLVSCKLAFVKWPGETANVLQRHFNASHCSYLLNTLQTNMKLAFCFHFVLPTSTFSLHSRIFWKIILRYFNPNVKLLWNVFYSQFLHILEF